MAENWFRRRDRGLEDGRRGFHSTTGDETARQEGYREYRASRPSMDFGRGPLSYLIELIVRLFAPSVLIFWLFLGLAVSMAANAGALTGGRALRGDEVTLALIWPAVIIGLIGHICIQIARRSFWLAFAIIVATVSVVTWIFNRTGFSLAEGRSDVSAETLRLAEQMNLVPVIGMLALASLPLIIHCASRRRRSKQGR